MFPFVRLKVQRLSCSTHDWTSFEYRLCFGFRSAGMNEALREESLRLSRTWMQHPADWLRDYLVSGVEDPRLNLQSALTRHFLIRVIAGSQFDWLMHEECRFAAVMNWLVALAARTGEEDDLAAVLYGLRRGADNVEGIAIPAYVLQAFSTLPIEFDGQLIHNYIEQFLTGIFFDGGKARLPTSVWDTFQVLWTRRLKHIPESSSLSVLEQACGSANDYRFFDAYGLGRFLNYTGVDLCDKNIENARVLFPAVHFETGNIFDIAARDRSFELCVIHDLFEHLSLEGLQAAVEEVCRVTRRGMCIGFFQMEEIAEHIVRPHEEYFWNLLSLEKLKSLFADHGFTAQIIHIGTFLNRQFGCEHTHNPNAYTFWLWRNG